jgi:hypothetical protein
VISYFVNEAKDEKLRLIVSNSEPVMAKEEKSTTTLISIVENILLNKDWAIQALYTKIASFSTSNPVMKFIGKAKVSTIYFQFSKKSKDLKKSLNLIK